MTTSARASSRYIATSLFWQVFVFLLALLIMFPVPLLRYSSRYPLHTPYFALVLFFPIFLHSLTVLPTHYFKSRFTKFVWLLRCLAIAQILLAQFYTQFSNSSYVAAVGFWLFSILYEVGYYLALKQQWEAILKRCAQFANFICIALLVYIIPLLLQEGPQILAPNNSTRAFLRQYVFAWPNYLSIYLVVIFWLIAYFSQTNRRYIWLLGITLLTILITFSRTGVTVLAITIFLWMWHQRRRRLLVILIALGLMLSISSGVVIYRTRASSPGDTLSQTLTNRVRRWEVAFEKWAEHPILGYGFQSYTEVAPTFYAISPSDEDVVSEMNSSHNDYVDLLVRGGILHSLAFWGFVVMLLFTGLRVSARDKKRGVLQYFGYIFLALLLAAFVQNPFKNSVLLTFFWYLAGVEACLSQKIEASQEISK